MSRSNRQAAHIDVASWLGKLAAAFGVLALLAFIAGFSKLYFVYKGLGCEWVLSYHGFQDFVNRGVLDLLVITIFSTPLYYGFKSFQHVAAYGLRPVGFVVIGLCASYLIADKLLEIRLSHSLAGILTYVAYYSCFSVTVAGSMHYVSEKKSYSYMVGVFGAFIFSAVFLAYLVYSGKTRDEMLQEGSVELITNASKGIRGVLIGGVNGNFLINLCNDPAVFMVAPPSSEWTVHPPKNEGCTTE
ncbi:hypothetical protein J3D47_004175 [Pseudomonas laurylsulfativorans]|uniref:hypothetical protein n=1 Tax=Pseudomonas laurylsulfativorans TaxID=1943631 RepID=UPI00209F82D3|nr:hypothetical protein [Pseudomonas laurylsulfativorans]MCP1419932.1 hypothetical protein [Pseudomonas laurylsulfativorans]